MARVFVGIGSNIDKENNIVSSVAALRAHFGPLEISNVYETPAFGFEGDDFHNLVVSFDSDKPPQEISQTLKQIEVDHHRTHGKESFASRTLDLDQLLHGDMILKMDGVNLPHPDVLHYNFILRPLAELAGDVEHPQEKCTLAQLWEAHASNCEMKRIEYEF